MKKIIFKSSIAIVTTAVFFLLIYSCTKQKLGMSENMSTSESALLGSSDLASSTATNFFKPTIGAPVDVATGNQWIENYIKSNRGMAKEYLIAAKDLKAILSNTTCVGICFYFAIDENNMAHILPVGVSENGRIMKPTYINTQKGAISWGTAQKWIANDPDPIDARFFGRNTFNRLFNDTSCLNIKAISALDNKNKPQLLLADAALNYQDLTMLSMLNLRYEDESAVCPPVCPIAL